MRSSLLSFSNGLMNWTGCQELDWLFGVHRRGKLNLLGESNGSRASFGSAQKIRPEGEKQLSGVFIGLTIFVFFFTAVRRQNCGSF